MITIAVIFIGLTLFLFVRMMVLVLIEDPKLFASAAFVPIFVVGAVNVLYYGVNYVAPFIIYLAVDIIIWILALPIYFVAMF